MEYLLKRGADGLFFQVPIVDPEDEPIEECNEVINNSLLPDKSVLLYTKSKTKQVVK